MSYRVRGLCFSSLVILLMENEWNARTMARGSKKQPVWLQQHTFTRKHSSITLALEHNGRKKMEGKNIPLHRRRWLSVFLAIFPPHTHTSCRGAGWDRKKSPRTAGLSFGGEFWSIGSAAAADSFLYTVHMPLLCRFCCCLRANKQKAYARAASGRKAAEAKGTPPPPKPLSSLLAAAAFFSLAVKSGPERGWRTAVWWKIKKMKHKYSGEGKESDKRKKQKQPGLVPQW